MLVTARPTMKKMKKIPIPARKYVAGASCRDGTAAGSSVTRAFWTIKAARSVASPISG
jgi:hypothetical protein